MNPNFPVYIVSKGRWDIGLTSKALHHLGVSHFIVVEQQELDSYAATKNDSATLLVLDRRYQDEYDTCDDLGYTKSKGPGAARNFAWDDSVKRGHTWHWVMDDNLEAFYRLHNNVRTRVNDGTILRCAEDFVQRYTNIAVSGLNYRFFVPAAYRRPPYNLNTRIYSCLLIRNDIPYSWRGRYNEDTDLSLRVLKDGWCTLQFNAFLCGKIATQTMKGGNTKEFYAIEGTLAKSQMLRDLHPDVSRLVWKFNRWHHQVDYRVFRRNALIRRDDFHVKPEIDNYGMKMVKL